MKNRSIPGRSLALACGWLALLNPELKALLVSVDFERNADPHLFSGVEAAASAANDAFGVAGVWNMLAFPLNPPLATNPAFTNLVDSTGAASAVDMAITGTVGGVDQSFLTHSLTGDYLYFNDANTSATITFLLSDLMPSGEFAFYAYSSDYSSGAFEITLDTDGDQDLGDETAMTVTNVVDGYFASVRATGSGQILGMLAPTGALSSHWAGFQIASVPEPGGPLLLMVAAGCAAILRRARGKRAPARSGESGRGA
jgi:hypothetical protein